jgi:hypothetical protein
VQALGHAARFLGGEAFELVDELQLEDLFVWILFDLQPLA